MNCAKDGCERPHHAGGLCGPHYQDERQARLGPCTVEDCDRLQQARGLCNMHRTRLARFGSLDDPKKSPEELFWAMINKDGANECWLFNGSWTQQGYGRHQSSGTPETLAHRISWHLMKGPIPDKMVVDHLCLNKLCVNPDHLEVVTRAENSRRALNGKGSQGTYTGHQRAVRAALVALMHDQGRLDACTVDEVAALGV